MPRVLDLQELVFLGFADLIRLVDESLGEFLQALLGAAGKETISVYTPGFGDHRLSISAPEAETASTVTDALLAFADAGGTLIVSTHDETLIGRLGRRIDLGKALE